MANAERWRALSRLYREVMDEAPEPTALVGRTIGSYQVLSLLGSGGMGDVYRARDTRLGRDVALKILPDLPAFDGDALSRFRREAQLLASLNHPHIAQIYGLEEADGVTAIVLELVEGETLADVIARGPIAAPEAARIGRAIAEALEAAHLRAIVHRDLKPANIRVHRDGTVKVLDFGLAKALAPLDGASSSSMVTAGGVLLGTPAYMAPEQARGDATDPRVDVWAFGVLLYEMLTGRSPFAGATVVDTLGAVLHREPDWHGLPWSMKPLLQLCLDKNPDRRLRTIAEARWWLEASPHAADDTQRRQLRAARTVAAACFVVALGMAGVQYWRSSAPAAPSASFYRFQVPPPPETTVGGHLTLSPDGRQLAFFAMHRGRPTIWVHSLEWGETRRVEGTDDYIGSSLIWSPDSRFIGYVGGTILKKIPAAGGVAQAIARVPTGWGGAAWNDEGTIVFGTARSGLMRVSDQGGPVVPLTTLDRTRGELGHGAPRFLPDGRHFIYARASAHAGTSALYVGRLDASPAGQPLEPLLVSESRPVYAVSRDPRRGHILLVTNNVLMAYPFDAESLSLAGDPITLVDGVGAVASDAGVFISSVSASRTGVLAFASLPRTRTSGIDVVFNWMQLLGREGGGGAGRANRMARIG